ncbi:MAG: glycosyltransferase family 4 protein [Myxococcota bacterium]
MSSDPRVLVIADAPLSENSGGAGLTLCNLLSALPPRNVLSFVPRASTQGHPPTEPWAARTRAYEVPFPHRQRAPLRYFNPLWATLNDLTADVVVEEHLAALRRFQPDVILASPITALDVHVAASAVRKLGVPHAVYFMDDWMTHEPVESRQRLESAARWLVATSSVRLMISAKLSAEYQRRFGPARTDDVVLQNPVLTERFLSSSQAARGDGRKVLVYAGAIWPMHRDALEALARAVAHLRGQGTDVVLRVHTSPTFWQQHASLFEPLGVEFGGHLPHRDVPDALKRADALVVACSFLPEWAPFSRYSIQTKLGEYLMTGRPVLVVGPDDAACAEWVAQHSAGAVLSAPSTEGLAAALRDLLGDDARLRALGVAGQALAQREHAREQVQPRFVAALQRACVGAGVH